MTMKKTLPHFHYQEKLIKQQDLLLTAEKMQENIGTQTSLIKKISTLVFWNKTDST